MLCYTIPVFDTLTLQISNPAFLSWFGLQKVRDGVIELLYPVLAWVSVLHLCNYAALWKQTDCAYMMKNHIEKLIFLVLESAKLLKGYRWLKLFQVENNRYQRTFSSL